MTTDAIIRPVISGLIHTLYPDVTFYEEVQIDVYRKKYSDKARFGSVTTFRADIMGFGKHIIGIEIKSDKDSLIRFKRQEPLYALTCQYNYIVIGEKFLQKQHDIPHYWGIIVVYEGGDGLRAEIVRESTLSPFYDFWYLSTMLWRDELIMLLKKHNLYKGMSKKTVLQLRQLLFESLENDKLYQDLKWAIQSRDGWRIPYQERYPYEEGNHIMYWEGTS